MVVDLWVPEECLQEEDHDCQHVSLSHSHSDLSLLLLFALLTHLVSISPKEVLRPDILERVFGLLLQ